MPRPNPSPGTFVPPVVVRAVIVLATTSAVVAGCGDRSGKVLDEPVFPPPATTVVATTLAPETIPPEPVTAPLTLITPWVDGARVPERHTCAGVGVSPAMTWSAVPAGTVELALSVVDLDADQFVHWLVSGLPTTDPGLTEGRLPDQAREWPNSAGGSGWSPLCPPAGEEHRYLFTLYALGRPLVVDADAVGSVVISELSALAIGRSTVSGLAAG